MVVRVYLREADHGRRKTLMDEILNILHDQRRAQGIVVFRGIAGVSETGEILAADLLRLSVDLPLVVEFFDEPSAAETAIGLLEAIVPANHILCWRAVQRQAKPAAP